MFNDYTTAAQFLPKGATGITPDGKEFYLSDIGRYQLKFIPKVAVKWDVFSKSGYRLPSVYSRIGVSTLPIINSYYSQTDKKPYIEFIAGENTYRAELNSSNFDLTPLNSLPSVSSVKQAAEQSAQEANEAHAAAQMSLVDQVLYSLKKDLKPVAFVVGGLLLLKLLKK